MPSASVAVIAGMPAAVAGILMYRFSRSTSHHSAWPRRSVRSVSAARRGSTSMETRPSTPSRRVVRGAHHVARPPHVVRGDHAADASSTVDLAQGQVLDLLGVVVGRRRSPWRRWSGCWSRRRRAARGAACRGCRWTAAPGRGRRARPPRPRRTSSASLSVIAFTFSFFSVAGRGSRDGADLGERGVRRRDHVVGGEAELLEQHLVRRARPVVLDADAFAGIADEVAPATSRCRPRRSPAP